MGMKPLLFGLLLSLPALSLCSPLYTLTAPNVLRIENEETVIVEAHNLHADLEVDIHLLIFPQNLVLLHRSKIHLTSANKYIASGTVKVPAEKLPKDSRRENFATLRAISNSFTLECIILISQQTGHIFIQTDKPIYTPAQTVLYRLLTVDNDLKPSKRSTIVELMNPQDIVVQRREIFKKDATGISGNTFKIPEIVNIGMWTIIASYNDAPDVNFTSQFEVKEYVLPSFEVTLDSGKRFFYVDDTELHITVTARYTYGKSVEGRAFVLFSVMKDGEKLSLPKSLQTVPITNGHGQAVLKKEHLTATFDNVNSLVGYTIYVSASVITHTGSDLVEAEKSDIKIVVTPYTILFTKTSKYFKPGMPFDLMVYITNPDRSPANGVPVRVVNTEVRSKTNKDGIAKLTINTPGESKSFQISVSTDDPNVARNQQASANMIAEPYTTQGGSRNYLHISVQKEGSDLLVHLNLRNDNKNIQEQIKYFTYMLINKGKIVKFGRQARGKDQVLVTMQIPITRHLIPSFRIVAYYYIMKGAQVEIVADSIWIDVEDTCMGILKVSATDRNDENRLYKPGQRFKLKITGDSGARVGLVAVDKAVFALSKKNKITQSKIWSVVEKNDIGCTPGSGESVKGVFSDAGLAFVTNTNIKTETRTELKCKQPRQRKRRATELAEVKAEKLRQFKDSRIQKCCTAGMQKNNMNFSCQKRLRHLRTIKQCSDVFLECCLHIKEYNDQLQRTSMSLSRSADDDYYTPYEDITARSEFPESWLWRLFTLGTAQNKNRPVSQELTDYLKDSITTWEIQAVSVSPNEGVCIAQPYEITVLKDFFIDLRLPYSAVRNEQVEIRAILYNYHDEEIEVRVEFPFNEYLCSSAKPTERLMIKTNVPAKSSTVVPYIIVPLRTGEITIEVKAAVANVFVNDGVRKPLLVVPEGVKVEIPVDTHILDPRGKEQKFDVNVKAPEDMVPNTEPLTLISTQGTIISETIENTIDGTKLKHLIRVPSGCGEQNMASMTPVVIVVIYLDEGIHWPKVGVEKRSIAINNIKTGYVQQLKYRKTDNSYAAFVGRQSSTWLTAYVVKVFAMARKLIAIDSKVLCGAVKWLVIHKLKPDGYFIEDAKVIHGEMIGGIDKSSDKSALTAFVLIAMHEAQSICSPYVMNYVNVMTKAADYLEAHINNIQRTYSAVISAYALSLMGRNKENIVMKFASPDKSFWPVDGSQNSLYTIESTGYALLFFLQLKKFEEAGKIVRWLSKRSEYGGGYSSTQATIIALQALARYLTDVPQNQELNLDVILSIPTRRKTIPWKFDTGNAYVARSLKLNSFEKFSVTAKGEGEGTLKVLTTYYALRPKDNKQCKHFNMDITVESYDAAKRPEGARNTLLIKICARYLSDNPSSMVILDISMLTGFSPDTNDLSQLKNEIENYISRFEMDKALSTRGSLIIYLDSVENDEDTCVAFKVHQYYRVGLIQPASVKIYEYYDTTKSCTKFYNVPGNSGMLNKICQGEVCKCAEGSCISIKPENENTANRDDMSCAPGTDYVYKVTFLEENKIDNYIYYSMKLLVRIKEGSDQIVAGDVRQLITHANCPDISRLELNKDYLIMGQSSDLWQDEKRIRYLIGEETWIEKWPNEADCQTRKYRQLCQDLEEFSENLQLFGCPT
ncbi:complement C3-like isoform X2 [Narcine bancroftii]|uniref:complement C3-like isoform X2 n=1 Tax=Narcine bancroftii TaxID=1343680 RepID=UPI0038322722